VSEENRRWEVAALKEEQRRFLAENPYVGVVTDIKDDGTPHSTVVWVDVEDGKVSFNTVLGRAKPRHLEQNPVASLTVVDPHNPFKWVSVSGHAELTEEGADEQIDKLAKKYLGQDEYPWRNPAETRVKVLIDPEHVDAHGFD
jgi:PPOX class probable F420-dependent enzyme